MKKLFLGILIISLMSFSFIFAADLTCDTNTFFGIGDSYTYLEKTITLNDLSSSSAIVDVDGDYSIITEGSQYYVGDLLIHIDEIFSRTDPTEKSANIFVGCVDEIACGESGTVHVDGSLIYGDTWIKLNDVSSTSAVVEVDGTSKVISEGSTSTVGSLRIKVDDVSSTTDRSTSKAKLTVPCKLTTSSKTLKLTGETEQGFFAKIWNWVIKAY